MNLELTELAADVRLSASEPLARLGLAAETAAQLVKVGDSLVSEFVDECRDAGHAWAEIAPYLSDSPPIATDSGVDPSPKRSRPGSDRENPQRVREHTGKYRPLWDWLNGQSDSEVQVSFSQLEEVLGFPLPRSCRAHQPHWYGYEGSAVARAIIDAGWRARNVDVVAETLTLARDPRRAGMVSA